MYSKATNSQQAKFSTASNLSKIKHIKHGFFGRIGGVSNGIYQSLNCGTGSQDSTEKVTQNRLLATKALNTQAKLCTLHQVHSSDVVQITQENSHQKIQADAAVTTDPSLALAILTADCVPLILADQENNICAIAHAGWKGAFKGIVQNTITEMLKTGSTLTNIAAAIGPAIAQKSYEVDNKFFKNFLQQDASNELFFIESDQTKDRFKFDLTRYVKQQLEICGIYNTEILPLDTYSQDDSFFSYRRCCHKGEPDYGRNISIITLA